MIQHLKEVYSSGELTEEATTRDFRVVQIEGTRSVSRQIAHYNLDAIISVGYRVNRARFLLWFTLRIRPERVAAGYCTEQRAQLPEWSRPVPDTAKAHASARS